MDYLYPDVCFDTLRHFQTNMYFKLWDLYLDRRIRRISRAYFRLSQQRVSYLIQTKIILILHTEGENEQGIMGCCA